MGGKRSDGIRTLDDLRDRCRINEETGCWMWAGSAARNGRPHIWLPVVGRSVTGSLALHYLTRGGPPRKFYSLQPRPTCAGQCGCLNPEHRRLLRMGDAQRGVPRPESVRLKVIIAGRSGRRSKLTNEQREEVRTSTEPVKVVAARYGISPSNASRIRLRSPVLPASSVFSWRPDAAPRRSTT